MRVGGIGHKRPQQIKWRAAARGATPVRRPNGDERGLTHVSRPGLPVRAFPTVQGWRRAADAVHRARQAPVACGLEPGGRTFYRQRMDPPLQRFDGLQGRPRAAIGIQPGTKAALMTIQRGAASRSPWRYLHAGHPSAVRSTGKEQRHGVAAHRGQIDPDRMGTPGRRPVRNSAAGIGWAVPCLGQFAAEL